MKRFWKRAAAFALCAALLCPAASAAYTDVSEGAWYEQAVTYCRDSGLLHGTGGGQFSPNSAVTRGMLAVVLYRLAGSPAEPGDSRFSDVAPGAWYARAVNWADRSGVMDGLGGGLFAPNEPVTREQLAAVLWRRAGSPAAAVSDFIDREEITGYARAAVDWAGAAKLMRGVGGGRFAPAQPLTRAQLAVVLMKLNGMGKASAVSAVDVMCQPCGLAAMEDGSLLVTDGYNKVVWRVSEGKSVLFAGADTVKDIYGQPMGGYHDDALLQSTFKDPWAIVPFLGGWAVSDPGNKVVRFLRTDGAEVTDLGIKFDHPTGLAVDGDGNLYVSETFQGLIKKITPDGKVTTLASGLEEPMGLCWAEDVLYVAECGGNRVLTVDKNRHVATAAGSGANGNTDGAAERAAFSGPKGVAVDADGAVYVADTDNGSVRRVQNGAVTTILSRDSRDVTALFPVSPTGLLIRGNTLYISDTFARKVLSMPLR